MNTRNGILYIPWFVHCVFFLKEREHPLFEKFENIQEQRNNPKYVDYSQKQPELITSDETVIFQGVQYDII